MSTPSTQALHRLATKLGLPPLPPASTAADTLARVVETGRRAGELLPPAQVCVHDHRLEAL